MYTAHHSVTHPVRTCIILLILWCFYNIISTVITVVCAVGPEAICNYPLQCSPISSPNKMLAVALKIRLFAVYGTSNRTPWNLCYNKNKVLHKIMIIIWLYSTLNILQ